MEQFVLKERLKEEIKGRAVVAALFHSFNFYPRFFENYVMPLFVPGKDFSDEAIYNKILWRSCLKEGIVPPVTVCCDYFAKDNTAAPALGYEIFCIKMPAAKGYITNFHPKHIFILLDDDSLLVITGSGNITPSGWCENFECFAIKEIKRNKQAPNRNTTNIFQDIILKTSKLSKGRNLSEAEDRIYNFLNYVDFNDFYFNSLHQSFREFINEHVLFDKTIKEVEIISPYFSNDTLLLDPIKEAGIKKIKCLIPTIKNNEIQLNEATFKSMAQSGVQWCLWKEYKKLDRNKEVRNLHAKIYRFIGDRKAYTIVGSVNFTNTAWTGFASRNNKGNVECAWLFVEDHENVRLLRSADHLNFDNYRFIGIKDPENPEGVEASRDVPEIDFIIDWKLKKLQVQSADELTNCAFKVLANKQSLKKGNYYIELSNDDIKKLSANAIIEVVKTGSEQIFVYYPRQLNIEMKPLDFRIPATYILELWQFLDDEYKKQALAGDLAERSTDASGVVDESNITARRYLNEMAAHFSSLVVLEKHLFPDHYLNRGEQREKFNHLNYYLLAENIDTVPYYINDIIDQCAKGNIQKSFCWMIIEIIFLNLYNRAARWDYRRFVDKKEWEKFKGNIANKNSELRRLAKEIAPSLDCSDKKLSWIEEQLVKI